MSDNPLSQYFRQPAIYVRLPSGGRFYPPDSLQVTDNNEYPVLPMTTIDEITYRTPDALFNGSAVCSVIKSCLPNIMDPWKMPSMDIDTVLVAIRIATYGHEMDISTKCPACGSEKDYALDLRKALESMTPPDYNQTIKQGDLEIYFKPMNYKQLNDNNLAQFEEQKALQIINEGADNEAEREKKMTQLTEILKKITSVTIGALAQSIAAVKTPSGAVTDSNHISEWLENCDRKLFTQLRDHIINTKRDGEIKPLKLQCPDCNNQYEQLYTLDMSSFFEAAS
jgi:hypothetical protein